MKRTFTKYPQSIMAATSKPTFKKFVKQIVNSADKHDAIDNVFYGPEGVDMAYQHGYISWEDHQLLLKLMEKLA